LLIMKSADIIDTIHKYSLHPATKRHLSLFTMSAIANGYYKLKNILGFTYEAMAALGDHKHFQTMINESYIADQTNRYILEHPDFEKVFTLAREEFNKFNIRLKKAIKYMKSDPEQFLNFLGSFPDYMLSIGIYNCFWRFSATEQSRILKRSTIKRIIKDREVIAKVYPRIDELLRKASIPFGKKYGFDGKLLLNMTVDEREKFLKTRKLDTEELIRRGEKYLYLFVKGKEHITTDKKTINKVENQFFKVTHADTIKGKTAYPGKIKAKAYNNWQSKAMPKGDFVLVTHNTNPKDLPTIKRCSAIVTDEGGMLSHAAIISRELKKPCIIGTKIATKVLKNGDLIEVDAENGVVKLSKA